LEEEEVVGRVWCMSVSWASLRNEAQFFVMNEFGLDSRSLLHVAVESVP